YASAGTVEFLLDGEDFWFLEVNTRLQVEHPVTEEITGLDLVREQLRIAEGEPLGYGQEDLRINGHAVEARLYAENPAKNFLPAPGTVTVWEPAPNARFDSGVESGTEVSMNFDPMIAKVIAHGPTRREASAKLARALEMTQLQGITHNRDFLVATLRSDAFIAGDTTTDFIERVAPARVREPGPQEICDAAVAAAMCAQFRRRAQAPVLAHIRSGWRNSLMPPERVRFAAYGDDVAVEYRSQRDGSFSVEVNGTAHRVIIHEAEPRSVDIQIGSRRARFAVSGAGQRFFVQGPTGDVQLEEVPRFPLPGLEEFKGGLFAPMPGKVLATEVSAGDRVRKGALLVVLEAMKIEHRITAPVDGTVREIDVKVGDQVNNGQKLVVLDEQ
ncbi:MAG: biotin/lipoyl-binding protein, partial [Gammaproteobacteria bacterium]|nr:biotin/lipoyl-binding protein [Gammaproteobacteria bacterium]